MHRLAESDRLESKWQLRINFGGGGGGFTRPILGNGGTDQLQESQ